MRKLRTAALVGAGLVAGALLWRALSRRRSLPCPAWLGFSAENPLVDKITRTSETLDRLQLGPGQRVLEVGPGAGRVAVPASRRVSPGGVVVALDIQPEMLARLKRSHTPNLLPVLGDATLPHFRPDTFDTIYLCTVLGEIPDREAALRHCYEALMSGGLLSITEILPDPHFQSRATVERLAAGAGFQLQQLFGTWRYFTANFVKPE